MEIEFGSLEETVLEVIEVEEHTVNIEFSLRITVGKVQLTGSSHLDIGQFTDGAPQQLHLLEGIASASLTPTTNGIEERYRAEVALQITQFVVADSQKLRNRQLALGEMAT